MLEVEAHFPQRQLGCEGKGILLHFWKNEECLRRGNTQKEHSGE